MKKVLLVLVVMLMGVKGWGQLYWGINFEDNWYLNRLTIDTVSCLNNKWQIGKPNKTVFDSSFSYPNAIVTDTLNPVPANDTSVFYIKHIRSQHYAFFVLDFWHKMDGDSTDFGKIEVMPDTEGVWVNVLEEDTAYNMHWWSNKPSLKGSLNGWEQVRIGMENWSSKYQGNLYPIKWNSDSVLIRFTYITDSGGTPHDGWMIDDIYVNDWFEGINEVPNESIIGITPNPVEDVLHIKRKIAAAKNESVQVMNMMGEVVMSGQLSVVGGELSVDVSGLAKGVYLLRYSCDKGEARERFVKE